MKFISGVRVDVCVESVDGSEYDDIDYDDCLAIFKSEKGMINFVTEKMLGGYGLDELQNYITNPKYSDCVEIHETDFADFDEDDEDGEKNDIEVTIASSSKEKVALVPFDSEDFKYRWCVQISYYENDVEEDTSEYEFADLTESRRPHGRMLKEGEFDRYRPGRFIVCVDGETISRHRTKKEAFAEAENRKMAYRKQGVSKEVEVIDGKTLKTLHDDFYESHSRRGRMLKESEEKIELNVSKEEFIDAYNTIYDAIDELIDSCGLSSLKELINKMKELMENDKENGLDDIFFLFGNRPFGGVSKAAFYLTMRHFKMI